MVDTKDPRGGQQSRGHGSGRTDDALFTAEPLRSASDVDRAQANKERARQIVDSGGDVRHAVKLLSDAVEVVPDAASLTLLADLEVANPLWRQKALDRLKQAVAIDPKHTPAWLALANYWSLRGQTDKQIRCLQRILSYEPVNLDVREALRLISPAALEQALAPPAPPQKP
ncbi:MAG: tetratricopeptide repeat protein [Acidobacteriota bacterium]